jgi:hypothetical protein
VIPAIIVLGLALVANSWLAQQRSPDVVSHEYVSYQAAKAGNSFAGGWLPRIIPASATRIVTINNLEANASRGEFHYDPADTAAFESRLRLRWDPRVLPADFKTKVGDMASAGYSPYEYRQGRAVWVFFVNRKEGHVLYDMAPR